MSFRRKALTIPSRPRAARQTPYPLTAFDTPGASWNDTIRRRWSLLDANRAIRQRYFSVGDPLNVFRLPTSRVKDMGNHYAVRTQRAVFQQWKEDVPWASRGQVTIANGGDIGKELVGLSGSMLRPEAAPGQGAPEPDRLEHARISLDGGSTWESIRIP